MTFSAETETHFWLNTYWGIALLRGQLRYPTTRLLQISLDKLRVTYSRCSRQCDFKNTSMSQLENMVTADVQGTKIGPGLVI